MTPKLQCLQMMQLLACLYVCSSHPNSLLINIRQFGAEHLWMSHLDDHHSLCFAVSVMYLAALSASVPCAHFSYTSAQQIHNVQKHVTVLLG